METRTSPRHGAAPRFAKTGFFDDIERFSDLESRVAALDTPNERGAAFEVFAEAYLATQRHVQADEVWPDTTVPASVLAQLRLPMDDLGADGVFKDNHGDHSAYQVKFRSGRPALRWGEKGGLSTFMGISDRADQRVLFTNCDKLPRAMNERSNFFCISGTDLDGLQAEDFTVIAGYIQGALVERRLKTPLPHQQEALAAITAGLAESDRATAIMACGTGKTLVALWTAERLGCRRVLVLVPSLALVRQTLHEWLKETAWERVSYLCVCSDPTVQRGMDNWVVEQTDVPFRVTTDSADVAAFLGRPFDGVQLVFSTYQSAHVVAEGMGSENQFDLGIFDEAHKTAGRKGTKFAFALHDENLRVGKRLFMTATPRHYDMNRRDKEGDARVVFSMDVPEDYGTRAYELPFAQAAKDGIICNYKVVISVVTSEMLDRELLRRGEVLVDGDVVGAQRVADQVALRDAVKKFGARRVFSFHARVGTAKSFVADGGQGIQQHLPDFSVFHVNGKMRTADREAALREFGEVERGLITNARCLTEGVDVPAVDMVAFMSPKRSKVDIVQATGRAMRTDKENPDKKTGYILLPLLVEQAAGESIEEALARTRFDDIWMVLQAMQEQDAELADVIRQMREDRGRTGSFDDRQLREKVTVLGPELTLRQIESAISAACVDRLGVTWDERYGELVAYKETHGDCNVPQRWPENPSLGGWIQTQRLAHKQTRGRLSVTRTHRLNKIGFVWDPLDAVWEEMFTALVAYEAAHGDCNVPARWSENPALARWVHGQRERRKRKTLSEELIRRLDEIGFVWDLIDAAWEKMFSVLVAYKAEYGNCQVPARWPQNPRLASWVTNQRQLRKRDKLDEERIRRLDEIGFVWDRLDAAWEKMFSVLVAYKAEYGDCNVPTKWRENAFLATWVSTQRRALKKPGFSDERRRRLDEIGFIWDPLDAAWEEMFAALVAYKAAHGDCNVTARWSENPALGRWVSTQRSAQGTPGFSDERRRRLDAIGFLWDPLDAEWEALFAALAAYKAAHGDCNVPTAWPGNPTLGQWVSDQRKRRKRNALSKERIHRLDEIGFAWDAFAAAWEEMFAALVAYKTEHGDCIVPTKWPGNRRLGRWVKTQRERNRESMLSEERIRRLDEIGFDWNPGKGR